MTTKYERDYKGTDLLSIKDECPDCGYEYYELYEKVKET